MFSTPVSFSHTHNHPFLACTVQHLDSNLSGNIKLKSFASFVNNIWNIEENTDRKREREKEIERVRVSEHIVFSLFVYDLCFNARIMFNFCICVCVYAEQSSSTLRVWLIFFFTFLLFYTDFSSKKRESSSHLRSLNQDIIHCRTNNRKKYNNNNNNQFGCMCSECRHCCSAKLLIAISLLARNSSSSFDCKFRTGGDCCRRCFH